MTRALVSGLDVTAHRDAVDLHLRASQKRSPDRRASRLVGPEPLGVDLIHRLEVLEIGEVHRRLRHAVERGLGRDQNGGEIVEDAPCLGADVVPADELPGLGIERELARAENEVARDDRLALRTDRCRGAVRF